MPRSDDDYRRDDDLDDRSRRRDDDRDYDPPPRKSGSSIGIILGIIAGVLVLVCGGGGVALFFATRKVGEAADRMVATNNMRQVGLACHNYESANGTFPADSYSPDGKPLLSWRVHILPFIEQDNLYRQFQFNEPWDSPANRRLLDQMPMIYATQDERKGRRPKGNQTYIRGFNNPGTMFARVNAPDPAPRKEFGFDKPIVAASPRGLKLDAVQKGDGTSVTIMALEAGDAVEWTKPGGLDASPGKPFPSLGGARPGTDNVLVIFADGTVKFIKKSVSEAQWRAATTYAGGENLSLED